MVITWLVSGSFLEELKRAGHLDGFNDLPPTVVKQITDHDSKVVSKYFQNQAM